MIIMIRRKIGNEKGKLYIARKMIKMIIKRRRRKRDIGEQEEDGNK